MLSVAIQIDKRDLARLDRYIDNLKRGAKKVRRLALKQATRDGKVETARQIGKVLNLKKASIKSRIKVWYGRDRGGISVRGQPPLLTSFRGYRQTKKKGASVQLRKGGPRERFPHVFRVMRNYGPKKKGGRNRVVRLPLQRVSKQRGTGSDRWKPPLVARYPIDKRVGPGPRGVLENQPGMLPKLTAKLGAIYLKALSQKLDYVVKYS